MCESVYNTRIIGQPIFYITL